MENEYGSFVFYQTFYESICELPEESQLHLYRAIAQYGLFEEEIELTVWEKAVFTQIRKLLADNHIKRKNGQKGAQYGELGGAPKGNQNARKTTPKQPQNKSKTTPNVNVNVDNNVVVVTREYFCKTYNIIDDDKTTDRLDFEMLGKAYSQSIKFLQCTECAKHMSWIVKHYSEIINGKYVDYVVDMQSKHRIDVQGVIDI